MTRTYESQEYCPVARTLDVIGDRWTLLILRDVTHGITKYSDMLESLKGISPNLLAQRLKRLEKEGVLERSFYSDHPPRAEYKLTKKGRDLTPVLSSMAEWGYEYALDDEARNNPRVIARMQGIERWRERSASTS
jgi:DNA-binding HxlR family transcriptional regulator